MDTDMLNECEITLVVRISVNEVDPADWDWNQLLDLRTGIGEQAWLKSCKIIGTGSEDKLDAGE